MKNLVKLAMILLITSAVACKGGASRGTMDSTATHPTDSTSTTVDTLAHQDTARATGGQQTDTTQK